MKLRWNIWLEKEEGVVLSLWRVNLLTAIAETGSISQAARQMDVPYRVAWQKIQEMETLLGEELVTTATGGKGGGGSRLTPTAQTYVAQFQQFQQQVESFVQKQFTAIFGESL